MSKFSDKISINCSGNIRTISQHIALNHFTSQCTERPILIASDNSTVAQIKKQGSTHSGEQCALMLAPNLGSNRKHQSLLGSHHIHRSLSVIRDGLSRVNRSNTRKAPCLRRSLNKLPGKRSGPHCFKGELINYDFSVSALLPRVVLSRNWRLILVAPGCTQFPPTDSTSTLYAQTNTEQPIPQHRIPEPRCVVTWCSSLQN